MIGTFDKMLDGSTTDKILFEFVDFSLLLISLRVYLLFLFKIDALHISISYKYSLKLLKQNSKN